MADVLKESSAQRACGGHARHQGSGGTAKSSIEEGGCRWKWMGAFHERDGGKTGSVKEEQVAGV